MHKNDIHLKDSEDERFKYKNSFVKIITVFSDNGKKTALVEDDKGEMFEVCRDALH